MKRDLFRWKNNSSAMTVVKPHESLCIEANRDSTVNKGVFLDYKLKISLPRAYLPVK